MSRLTGCRVTSRPHGQFSRYSKWLDTFRSGLINRGNLCQVFILGFIKTCFLFQNCGKKTVLVGSVNLYFIIRECYCLQSGTLTMYIYRLVQSQLTHFRMNFCLATGGQGGVRRQNVMSSPNLFSDKGSVQYVARMSMSGKWHFHMSGIIWPVHSLDLSVMDFLLWGCLKECIYRNHPHTQHRCWSLLFKMKLQP
jgi:hypothetical protein